MLYLNGEYWGVYFMKEKRNRFFVAQHENTENNVDLAIGKGFKQRSYGDNSDWVSLYEYATSHDLSSAEAYAYVSERMDVDRLTDQLHTMEEERAKRLNSIDELRERRDNISAELNDIKERSHRAELNLNKAQLELQNMQDRIWSDYELTYENAQPMRRQIAITASHIRVDELKAAIRALGDVNVGSIEDYKNVKERYDELNAQYEDLTKAEADLQLSLIHI